MLGEGTRDTVQRPPFCCLQSTPGGGSLRRRSGDSPVEDGGSRTPRLEGADRPGRATDMEPTNLSPNPLCFEIVLLPQEAPICPLNASCLRGQDRVAHLAYKGCLEL